MLDELAERIPRFYGSVTVGERGQVAIPAEARRDQEITPGCKLLAFSGPDGRALVFVKAEFVTEFITGMTLMVSHVEQALKTDTAEEPE
jgi:bifunctional DNA-binding transcriptional regulator/antitoxin component of YhaV-PrlF toxin-antitoxin module